MAGTAGDFSLLQREGRRYCGFQILRRYDVNRMDVIFGRTVMAAAQLLVIAAVC
jgi:hypothetical protein